MYEDKKELITGCFIKTLNEIRANEMFFVRAIVFQNMCDKLKTASVLSSRGC